jgi:hypothetical protein
LAGAGGTLTVTASARTFYDFTVTGTKTFTSPGFTAAPQFRNAFTNSGTVTLASCNIQIYSAAAITAWNCAGGALVNSSTVSTVYVYMLGSSATWDNIGSITDCHVAFQALSGSNNTATLGDDLTLTTSGNLSVLNNGGTNTTLNTATFDLSAAATTSVGSGAAMLTGADAAGATWTFNDTVTVTGTMAATATSGQFSLALGTKTIAIAMLTMAAHAVAGSLVMSVGPPSVHVDQRTKISGGQISNSKGVNWSGVYIEGAVIAAGADMRGAWFGKGCRGVFQRTPSTSVQGIGPLGVRRG